MGRPAAPTWPFAERHEQLAEYVASDGRVVLAGSAGVGKSRLLAELARLLAEQGHRVVRVGATHSLSTVPLGALAGVLAAHADVGTPFDSLQRALAVLVDGRNPREVHLIVDDAHLLDDQSAGLVLLAAQTGVAVGATIRSGEPCPDAVLRLWTDAHAQRVDVPPLDEAQVGALLEVVLGARIDPHSARRIIELTSGNLLFLRELIQHAVVDGSLREVDGMWSWSAHHVGAPSLHELMRSRVGELDTHARDLLSVLAIAEPLDRAAAEGVAGADALDVAERAGLAVWISDGSRQELRLSHPMYGELLREGLGAARRTRLAANIVAVLERAPQRRRDDVVRLALMRLDAGLAASADELERATRIVGARADLALAERFAKGAITSGGGPASEVLLADVLYWQGRHEEVVARLRDLDFAACDPLLFGRAMLLIASSLYWGLGRLDEADDCLLAGIERLGPQGAQELVGQRAQLLMFAGKALESIAVGRPVAIDAEADPAARLRAYAGVLPSLAVCGRLEDVEADLPTAMGLVLQVGPEQSAYASGGVIVAMFIARMFGGGLDSVDQLAGALYDDALRRADDPFRGVYSFVLGRSALAQGDLAKALVRLRESTALLRARDPGGMLPWALAALAQTQGLVADAGGSAATMRELDAVRVPTMHNIDIDIELGRAWATAARGELSAARQIAEKVGRAHIDDGRVMLGLYALHDSVRLGLDPGEVLGLIRDVAADCEGPVAEGFAAHAAALVAADGDALIGASGVFATSGWMLHAAEAAANAAQVFADAGLRARRNEAAATASRYVAACGHAWTPMLAAISERQSMARLTRREQEVALMAARGMSKREIAEALFLSQRTVGNHINHVYGKLGIGSREELRAAIDLGAAT